MATIEEALRRFNPADIQADLAAAERERTEITNRFPLERWPEMPLEDYALGQDRDKEQVFSWWLEFGSMHMGDMRGGFSNKFAIYRRKTEGTWSYRPEFTNEREAWDTLRQGFVTMLDYAQQGRWNEIDGIKGLYGTRSVRAKVLHTYFPDQVLPIYSSDHLNHFLNELGVPREARRNLEVVALNRLLLDKLRKYPEASTWNTVELMYMLYQWNRPLKEVIAQKIVKIAPGPEGEYWQNCLENGYIRVGWDDVGDLRAYQNENDFRVAFEAAFSTLYNEHQQTIRKNADELWTLRGLKAGDKIVANRGVSAVLGIGTVTGVGYEWLAGVDEYRHAIRVTWDTTHAREMALPDHWRMVTVAPVSPELYQQIIRVTDQEAEPVPAPIFGPIADALERKGQVILHGPPGTGKTYHALNFAKWWLARENGGATGMDKARQTPRRVWWVVANPKTWDWNKLFREGSVEYRYGRLQRNYPLVQPGDLVVGYTAAPEKRITALARIREGLHGERDEQKITLEPLHRIENGLSYSELTEDETLRHSEPVRFRCQGTLFRLESEEAEYLFSLLAERDPQIADFVDQTELTVEAANPLTLVTFHPSYSYEDFIEGFRPQDSGEGLRLRLADGLFKTVCSTASAHPDRKFLIIVDEINRANLAKVFGEIITLLERDKRGIPVLLPQSKDPFVVPKNVYMLGTMNTSDRSIRLMDAALRRRFSFIEIMPDLALLRGAQIDGRLELYDYLTLLNSRISRVHGREKQIGHAFFLESGQPVSEASDFAQRFRQEILPLLQEYCYDDYAQLAEYVGVSLVDIENATLRDDVLYDDDRLVSALAEFTAVASA